MSICRYVYDYIYVCMYICMYVYMYICIYVYMYISIYVSMYLFISVYMYICMYVYMYIRHRALGHDSGVFLMPSRSLLDVWMSVLEIPKGFLGARTPAVLPALHDFF